MNFYYENSRSRRLLINKGIIHVAPAMGAMWLLLILANMGVPPTLNLVRELLLFIRVVPVLEEMR